MLARRIKRPDGTLEFVPHRVEVDGPDFIARCGERWSRKEDGEVLPDHYTGEVCKSCG